MSSFRECPYQWFLRYIRRLREEPRFYASFGSFMHRLFAAWYNGELSKEEAQIKYLFDFRKEVQGPRPQESTVKKYVQAGSLALRNLQPLPFDPIAIEQKVDFKIAGVPFVGFIDFLGERGGDLVIVDHKSRDLKPRSGRNPPTKLDMELDEKLMQLYLYAEAVRQHYGRLPARLCFNCFKSGVLIEEPFSGTAFAEAKQWALDTVKEIENESEFPPNREYFRCRWLCGLNGECCYWMKRGEI